MNPNHLAKLESDFHFGKIVSIVEITEGVLNKNYILETDIGKFFIKRIREKAVGILPATVLVEELMRERGIPAICMLSSKTGEKFVVYDGTAYSVYSFIESDRSHKYSFEDYRRMGVLLGEIHKAGSYEIPELLARHKFIIKPKNEVIKELEEHKTHIQTLPILENIDKEFLDYIDLKLSLISSVDLGNHLANETLTHGDYHAGNLLIEARSRKIIGVCDWEKARMAPRAYELARSLLYISFAEEYTESTGLESASEVITGYMSVYPITKDEMREGLRARLHHTVCSAWLERQHYELKDSRADYLVAHEARLIRDFVQGDFASKLVS